jgi:hypothetical protein
MEVSLFARDTALEGTAKNGFELGLFPPAARDIENPRVKGKRGLV